MEDVDTLQINEHDDHALMLEHVFGDEHDLMFLDNYLAESFRPVADAEEETL